MLPYLDLPPQHSHPEVLRAMNRPWQADVNERLLDQIREQLPNAVLRTTLIVGFQGKRRSTSAPCRFLERERFDHVGVFTFSPKTERRRRSAESSRSSDGPGAKRCPDGPAATDLSSRQPPLAGAYGGCADRTAQPANRRWWAERPLRPEVDGEVHVQAGDDGQQARPGAMVPVRINGADIYDLSGQIVGARAMVAAIRADA